MATLAELVVKIGADVGAFEGGMNNAKKKMDNFATSMRTHGGNLTTYMSLPLAGVSAMAIKMAGDFEQTEIAFTTMLGSAEDSKEFLDELKTFAAETPFEFTGLTKTAQAMMGMGIEAKNVVPMLENVGNAVAGLGGGDEEVKNVTRAIAQMHTKGKVSAEEMMQLAEAGIGGWRMLADHLNTDVATAMAEVTKGAVSSKEGIDALMKGMAEQYGGLMDLQSKTLLGQISNLQDKFGETMRNFGAGLVPAALAVVEAVKPLTEWLGEVMKSFAEMDKESQSWIVWAGALGVATGPLLIAISSVVTSIGTIKTAMLATIAISKKWSAALLASKAGLAGLAAAVVLFVGNMAWEHHEGLEKIKEDNEELVAVNEALADKLRKAFGEHSIFADQIDQMDNETVRAYNDRLNKLQKDIDSGLIPGIDGMKVSIKEKGEEIDKVVPKVNKAIEKFNLFEHEIDAVKTELNDARPALNSLKTDMGPAINELEALQTATENFGTELDLIPLKPTDDAVVGLSDLEALTSRAKDQLGGLFAGTPESGTFKESIDEVVGNKDEGLIAVSTIMTDLSKDLADTIISGGSLQGVFKDLGLAITRDLLEGGLRELSGIFTNMMGGGGGSGGWFGTLGGIFGGGKKPGSTTAESVVDKIPGGLKKPKLPGSAVGAMNPITAVSSVVDTASSIFGNFQMAEMNSEIKQIGHWTKLTAGTLGGETSAGFGGLGIRDTLFHISEQTDINAHNTVVMAQDIGSMLGQSQFQTDNQDHMKGSLSAISANTSYITANHDSMKQALWDIRDEVRHMSGRGIPVHISSEEVAASAFGGANSWLTTSRGRMGML